MEQLPYSEIVIRLLLAALFGGIIGLEREKTSRFAGLRTNMLVCIGSALIMIVSQYGFYHILQQEHTILDPSRIAAQVVSGIGFLGAGTILFLKDRVRGLTTAASLWVVAGVGLTIGGGLYFAASTATCLVFVVLAVLKPLEKMLFNRHSSHEIAFVTAGNFPLSQLDELLHELHLTVELQNLQIESQKDKYFISLFFKEISPEKLLHIGDTLKHLPEVEKFDIKTKEL